MSRCRGTRGQKCLDSPRSEHSTKSPAGNATEEARTILPVIGIEGLSTATFLGREKRTNDRVRIRQHDIREHLKRALVRGCLAQREPALISPEHRRLRALGQISPSVATSLASESTPDSADGTANSARGSGSRGRTDRGCASHPSICPRSSRGRTCPPTSRFRHLESTSVTDPLCKLKVSTVHVRRVRVPLHPRVANAEAIRVSQWRLEVDIVQLLA